MDTPSLLTDSPLGLVIAFGAGMLSFLSPCVLPLVPGYLSLMSGLSVASLAEPTGDDLRRLTRSTFGFVAGFTLVFVFLGATASVVGRVLLEHQAVLNRVAGVVIIAMGLFLAGAITPQLLQRERRFQVSPSRLGVLAPPVMGMAFAFGWTPCIGSVLSVVLTLAAADGTLSRGVLLLAVYSLGLGVPFVAAGVAFGRLGGTFAWVKRHFRAINVTSGVVLAAFGLVLVTGNVGWLAARLIDMMDAVGLDGLTAI